jgi:chromate transporter
MQKVEKFKLLGSLFFTFFKISPVSFGGGYAMIPLLENAVTEKKKWVKREDITDVLVMAQTVPGSIAVNTATFIGYRLAGIPGAVVATLGIVMPTFLIVLILAMLFLGFKDQPVVEAAFQGIRPAIIALIAFAAINIGKTAIYNKGTAVVAMVSFVIFLFMPIHPILVLIAGGLIGVFVHRKKIAAENRRKRK